MPFIKCSKTGCPMHATQHFKYLKGDSKSRCCAPVVLLKRKDKQHLAYSCLEDVVWSLIERR